MPDLKQFRLPDVGEGLTEAEIVTWKVKPGDAVALNDPIVEIETAKSLVELPSPYAGVVTDLLVGEGETVDVGTPIIAVDTDPSPASETAADPVADPTAADPAAAPAQGTTSPTGGSAPVARDDLIPPVPVPGDEEAVEPGLIGGPAPGGRTSVLVGYGPRTTTATRRPRKPGATPPARETAAAARPVPATPPPAPDPAPSARASAVSVLAKPPVRKLAKDLGVALSEVTPTGPGGTITRVDVERAAAGELPAPEPPPEVGVPAHLHVLEREERRPVKGVRRMTAQAMVASAFTAPHVTEFLTVDVTRTTELVERLRGRRDLEGVRVGPLLLVMKALLLAVRRHPEINASWDDAAQEIVLKRYVNLGIAAATPRGLVVPNIKDADRMTLPELARALDALVTTAREGRTPPQDMAGGTITITNVGVFGVDTGTPILNPGEAAILAFGAVRAMPWVVDGQVVSRQVTQLALSFDHRLVDGELGSRFLADIGALLEDPELALAWG